MTYRELAAEVVRLPIEERLMLLDALTQSLRADLGERSVSANGDVPKLVRGMLKAEDTSPEDLDLHNAYVDYLIEKYL